MTGQAVYKSLLSRVFNTKPEDYAGTAYRNAELAANWPNGKSLRLRFLVQDEATGMYAMGLAGREVLWTYDVNQATQNCSIHVWSTAVGNLKMLGRILKRTDLRIATVYV